MAILKDVVNQIKKYAKAGTKLATFPVTKLAKTYKASDFKRAIDKIASTPILVLNNQEGIIKYWQAMCNNYDKNYEKVFRKYYNKSTNKPTNVKKTGVAAVFVEDLDKLFTMTKKTQNDNSYVEEIKEKLTAREPWLKNATPNGLKRDIDTTLKKLNISRPNVSENKDITIGEYVASILDDQKVLKAICSLNNKLNLLFNVINSQPPEAAASASKPPQKPQPPIPQPKLTPPTEQAPQPPKVQAPQPPKAATSAPSTPPPPPPRKPEQETPQANPKANQNSTAPATKQSNQSSPPSISDNLKRSIETIFDRLTFTEELSNTQNENLKNLKKYFKDNAKTITNNIMDLKDSENRNAWVKYFTDKPFSKKMVYNGFENSIYGNDGLFREMGKDRIKPDAITPKSLPEGVKLPTQKQQSAHSQTNSSGRPLPKPNPPKNTTPAPSNKQQQTNSNKATEVANVAAAVTAARASAATAEEAAAKAKQLATDTSTAENAKNAAENAKNAQQAAKIVEDLAEDIAKIVNEISANDLKEYVKNANEAAEKAKEFAELAKKFAGITDDDDEYDD